MVDIRREEVDSMDIKYRKATVEDADLLIQIYNDSFYSDYIKYGECPAYGKTKADKAALLDVGNRLVPLLGKGGGEEPGYHHFHVILFAPY